MNHDLQRRPVKVLQVGQLKAIPADDVPGPYFACEPRLRGIAGKAIPEPDTEHGRGHPRPMWIVSRLRRVRDRIASPEGLRVRRIKTQNLHAQHDTSAQIEALLGCRLYLDLHVRMAKDWWPNPKYPQPRLL
jgi:hypothetical protein